MPDPTDTPTPLSLRERLSEADREVVELVRASFSPPDDFVCGPEVQRVVAIIDRQSSTAEVVAEVVEEAHRALAIVLDRLVSESWCYWCEHDPTDRPHDEGCPAVTASAALAEIDRRVSVEREGDEG